MDFPEGQASPVRGAKRVAENSREDLQRTFFVSLSNEQGQKDKEYKNDDSQYFIKSVRPAPYGGIMVDESTSVNDDTHRDGSA